MPMPPFKRNPSNKYNAKKTVVDGITFASGHEARRYVRLRELEQKGEICNLELQPAYPIFINGVKVFGYKADFRYYDQKLCRTIVEDAKGRPTRDYLLRKKVVEAVYQIKIVEV